MKMTNILLILVVAAAMQFSFAAAAAGESWIELLKSADLSAWRAPTGDWRTAGDVAKDPQNERRLTIQDGSGTIVNGEKGRTGNLLTQQEFGDIEAHIEFMIPAKSNSGVYFMGRYELQVYDSFGVAKDQYPGIECGGIYPRWVNNQRLEGHSPRANASLPPGQWQTFDVIFHAPRFDTTGRKVKNAVFIKAVHNGQVIHENVEVTGPTRAASFNDEKPTGPLMLQADHGPVAYRHLRVRPLAE